MKRGMQWQWLAGALVCAVFLSAVGAPGVFAWREKTQDQRRLKRDNATERRIALVIGNGAYRYARRLPNPANDARAMAQALREAGFEVLGPRGEGYVDLDLKAMLEAITELGATLQKSGGVGLLYFAGHGVQANETNYLIPIDADPDDETKLKYQALDLKDALNQFVGNQLNIVILDACRDNPFKRSFQRTRGGGGDGLRAVEAPSGTLIAYSTAPGKTASDGSGANGLYTAELLEAIRVKGLTIEQTFKRVRVKVQEKSKETQTPWEHSSLNDEFYFYPVSPKEIANGEPQPDLRSVTPVNPIASEREEWEAVKDSNNPEDFRVYLKKFPNGNFAETAKVKLRKLETAVKPSWQAITTTQIKGTVVDGTGAAIAGTTVTVVNEITSETITTSTDLNGKYKLKSINPGTYTVTFKATAFKVATIKVKIVKSGRPTNVDINLEPGAYSDVQ